MKLRAFLLAIALAFPAFTPRPAVATSIDIAEKVPWVAYTATSGQTTFPYPWPVYESSALRVWKNDILRTLTTDYSVTSTGAELGGNVIFGVPLTAGDEVIIARDNALERTSQYGATRPFTPDNVNKDFNRVWMALQDIETKTRQTPAREPENWIGVQMTLPAVVSSKCLGWGDPITGQLKNVDCGGGGGGGGAGDCTDCAAILPGGRRTVDSLEDYLAHNAVFEVQDYGASCNGSALDDSAFLDAALDCTDAGGGKIHVPATPLGCVLSVPFELPDKCSLVGDSGGSLLIAGADDQAAVVSIDSSSDNGNRDGVVENLFIDGDSKALVGLYIGASVQRHYENIQVENCKSAGIVVHRAQNNSLVQVNAENNGETSGQTCLASDGSTTFECGAGIRLEDMAGNNEFFRSEFRDNKPYQGIIWDGGRCSTNADCTAASVCGATTAHVCGGGFPGGPSGNSFTACEFEGVQTGGINQLYIRAGRFNEFISTSISANGATGAFTGVRITQEDRALGCTNCNAGVTRFLGGDYSGTAAYTTAFGLEATSGAGATLFVDGMFFENHLFAFDADSSSFARMTIGPNNTYGGVTNKYGGSGAVENVVSSSTPAFKIQSVRESPTQISLQTSGGGQKCTTNADCSTCATNSDCGVNGTCAATECSNAPVCSFGTCGDSVPRYRLLADGTQQWGPGNGSTDVQQYPHTTAGSVRTLASSTPYCFNGRDCCVTSGSGSPEGVVTAPVCWVYLRNDGGAGTTIYTKESGSGNTGWAAPGGTPGAATLSFVTLDAETGTDAVADSATDTVQFRSADASCAIVGGATDSIDWSCGSVKNSGTGTANNIPIQSGGTLKLIKDSQLAGSDLDGDASSLVDHIDAPGGVSSGNANDWAVPAANKLQALCNEHNFTPDRDCSNEGTAGSVTFVDTDETSACELHICDGTTDIGTLTPGYQTELFQAGRISTDGTLCTDPAEFTIAGAGSPKTWGITCDPANSASTMFGDFLTPASYSGGPLLFAFEHISLATESKTVVYRVSCMCRGDGDVVDTTYGSITNVDVGVATAAKIEQNISGPVTCNGTCGAHDHIFWKATVHDSTDATDWRVLAVELKYPTNYSNDGIP